MLTDGAPWDEALMDRDALPRHSAHATQGPDAQGPVGNFLRLEVAEPFSPDRRVLSDGGKTWLYR